MSSKEYLKEWLGWLDFIKCEEDIAKYLRERVKESVIKHEGHPTAFIIMSNGKMAGTIDFNDIDKSNKIGRIGYWLGEEYQRKGIMTKALKCLIDYGFKELGLNKIEIKAATDNQKSRALPKRLGFVEEGNLRQAEWLYDHYVDHVIYGLLREE